MKFYVQHCAEAPCVIPDFEMRFNINYVFKIGTDDNSITNHSTTWFFLFLFQFYIDIFFLKLKLEKMS